MKNLIIHDIQDQDLKVITPLLDTLGIKYKQHKAMKEVADPELLQLAKDLKDDPIASKEDKERVLKDIEAL